MVNDDPKILKPLDSMIEKLEKVIKYLAYFDLTVEKLRELAPFKKEDARKVRNIIRGGIFNSTRRHLIRMNNLITEVSGLIDFYAEYSDNHFNLRSLYGQLRTSWTEKSETGRQRRVCLATIDRYLGFNQEGLVMKALGGDSSDQVSKNQLAELRKMIAGLIGIINQTKGDVEHLKSQYKHLGIHKSVF
ncbi:MAG: hypothetical protein AABX04_00040 [Nanoarchaeota archaeon]